MALEIDSFAVRLRERHGATLYILAHRYGVPQGLLASIIGNENQPLNPAAARFEPAIHAGLVRAAQGGKPFWGVWTIKHLQGMTAEDLRVLSTSWGLGQILGINLYAAGYDRTVIPAMTPAQQIEAIARRLKTGLGANLPSLEACLRWWNSGRMDGKTYDELMHERTGGKYPVWYVERGTETHTAYERLLETYPTLDKFQAALIKARK